VDFLDAEGNIQVGSTASTAVLIGNHLYVANVGDSRAVMSKAGKGYIFLKFYRFTSTVNIVQQTCMSMTLAIKK